ncbi:hypothetical protein VTI28DRAFT_6098 [Corynascus sepedonium]
MTQTAAIFEGAREPALLEWNFANLLDAQAERYGENVAISSLHQGQRWTYAQVRAEVRKLASRLVDIGIKPGDRIILLAGNGIEFIQVFFAAAAIGAVAVLAGRTFSVAEFQDTVTALRPRCIFIAKKIGFHNNTEVLRQIANDFKDGPIVVLGGAHSGLDHCVTFEGFLAGSTTQDSGTTVGSSKALDELWDKSGPTEPCCFQFTSGTTGARKTSMLSHRNLINNANFVGRQLRLSACDKLCCCPPLSHCFGLVCGLLAIYLHGGALVIPSEIFSSAASLVALREEGCTVAHGVPSMFEALVDQERERQAAESGASPCDYKLRTGIIAGSTPPRDLLQDIQRYFGLERLLYPFGMTELSAVCICTSLDDSLIADNTSVGRVMPHTSVKVVDENGDTLPPESPGELCVSGYLVHLGYFRNEAKTQEALHVDSCGRQWLRTGDLAVLEQTGRCKIIGRSKDMIKKHGENIVPKDIEELLLAHASVAHAAVVGIPHPRHGESVVAFVQLTEQNGVFDERELKTWLRQQKLAPHKMPDYFLSVGKARNGLSEIPVNSSGKVLKSELRSFAVEALQAR